MAVNRPARTSRLVGVVDPPAPNDRVDAAVEQRYGVRRCHHPCVVRDTPIRRVGTRHVGFGRDVGPRKDDDVVET